MNKDIKEIREYIACPQLGDDHYGEWGALRLDQRIKIKQLLDYITNLQEENEELKEKIENLTTMTVCGDRKQIKNTAQYKLDIAQAKIDKAIEYIEQYKELDFCDLDLLDILRGEE